MKLSDWARNEIDILKNSECDEYTLGVLNSALKAFISVSEDGHSGMSVSMTGAILDRMIKCKPLSAIHDEPDQWDECVRGENEPAKYQHKRCPSVFKEVLSDGLVIYKDIDRFTCVDIHRPSSTYHSGNVAKIASRFFEPITFPYEVPTMPIKIYTEDFLLNADNGDFDHRAIFYAKTPDDEVVAMYVYQREDYTGVMVEISKEEYEEDKKNRIN